MRDAYLSLDMEAGERIVWPSIGECIYCRAIEVDLTDEHVVPFALTGNSIVFEKACCKPCSLAINPAEQFVLRRTYGNLRIQLDTPTRRRKDRRETIDHPFLLLNEQGRVVRSWTVQTPWNRCPIMCPSWRSPLPGIMTGRPPSADIPGAKWFYQDDLLDRFVEMTRRFFQSPGIAYEAGHIDGRDFLRFIAKTAHAYAVGTFGIDAYDWLTTGVILGTDAHVSHLVGGLWELPEPDPAGAAIRFDFGHPTPELPYAVVKIRLFEFLGTPEHLVIVGRGKPERPEAWLFS